MHDDLALRVRDLRVEVAETRLEIVDEVGFDLVRGEVLGLVGESGCGKTAVAMALLNHARPGTQIAAGQVLLGATNILELGQRASRKVRGQEISYVPQDPARSLNPRKRLGDQIDEVLAVHGERGAATRGVIGELLEAVRLPTDRAFLRRFPHQVSGGQQQRVLLVMAMVCGPRVVVLDEPTTGLDVTTQASVLQAIEQLRQLVGSAVVYVTHDLAVLTNVADRIGVMYAGRLVELGPASAILGRPKHPYTMRLIAATPSIRDNIPRLGIAGTAPPPGARPPGCSFAPRCPLADSICVETAPVEEHVAVDHLVRCHRWRLAESWRPVHAASAPRTPGRQVLQVDGVSASYGQGSKRTIALQPLTMTLDAGECLGVVGESGSGKSTLARCISGLHAYAVGEVRLDGVALRPDVRRRSSSERQAIQLVYQNPDRSLNPRRTVLDQVGRPLRLFRIASGNDADAQAVSLLERVRLPASFGARFPTELSGGERQRVAIARALAARPRVLLCDEITSALDVSVQAAILSLLDELRREEELAVLLISHDLGVVNSITERVIVLHAGVVCEQGVTGKVLASAEDEYTRSLIAASPELPTVYGGATTSGLP